MEAIYSDMEDDTNPLNGERLKGAADTHRLFLALRESLKHRPPFSFELNPHFSPRQ